MYSIRTIDLSVNPPKVCVPVFGRDAASLRESCLSAKDAPFDVIEWRADFWADLSALDEALFLVRRLLPSAPLLATFRTKEEGGERAVCDDAYFSILHRFITSGIADAVDVEYFHDPKARQAAIVLALAHSITPIVSSHNFKETPSEGELEALLESLVETGGVGKLAVMPHTPEDVLALLSATLSIKNRHRDLPLITMAMGPLGMITRLAGETFGSALTFGTAKAASAPGQLPARALKEILNLLHES